MLYEVITDPFELRASILIDVPLERNVANGRARAAGCAVAAGRVGLRRIRRLTGERDRAGAGP